MRQKTPNHIAVTWAGRELAMNASGRRVPPFGIFSTEGNQGNEALLGFRHQRPCFAEASHGTAKTVPPGNLNQDDLNRFVSFVAFCKNGLEKSRRALPQEPAFER
jgi:hypothetical protein